MNTVKSWQAHGFNCLVLSSSLPMFGEYHCGYVGVPPGHPWHGADYDSVSAEVHGGLTFSGKTDDARKVDGQPDLYWLGFDLAHLGDRNLGPDYCAEQAEGLAKQALEAVAS